MAQCVLGRPGRQAADRRASYRNGVMLDTRPADWPERHALKLYTAGHRPASTKKCRHRGVEGSAGSELPPTWRNPMFRSRTWPAPFGRLFAVTCIDFSWRKAAGSDSLSWAPIRAPGLVLALPNSKPQTSRSSNGDSFYRRLRQEAASA